MNPDDVYERDRSLSLFDCNESKGKDKLQYELKTYNVF